MQRDIFLSLGIHLLFLSLAFITSPFDVKPPIDYGEVIRVSLPSAAQIAELTAPPPEIPVEIPKPVIENEPDIPISDPISKPAVEIEKPKPKPEPKKEPEKKKPVKKTPDPKKATTGDNDQAGKPDGKVDLDAATAGGGVLSGATIDNAAFDYPYWNRQAFPKIQSNFRNPVNYDGILTCMVHFEVLQSGRVFNINVVQSSGIPRFDQACLAAVERSAPLPPLPQEFLAEIIDVTLNFEWEPK